VPLLGRLFLYLVSGILHAEDISVMNTNVMTCCCLPACQDVDGGNESGPDLDAGNDNDDVDWPKDKRSDSPEDLHDRLNSR
jgi:hypothetical protein